jgi:hypothetical protein
MDNLEKEIRIRWKVTGGGTFRVLGRTMKPGEEFDAFERDIPLAFRDVVTKVLPKAVQHEDITNYDSEAEKEVKLPYWKKREKGNWYDVFDKDGKIVSQRALNKKDAEQVVSLMINNQK